MCITKVESYSYGGKLFDTELDATNAALKEIGTRIVKDYHSHPLEGLIKYGTDLVTLLVKQAELTEPTLVTEVTSGKPWTSMYGGHV